MGITAKSKPKTSSENWGMGLLLVFFPEDNSSSAASSASPTSASSPSSIVDSKANSTSSFSSSSFKTIKRTNSNNPILTKTQSTISICALLLFLTLLLFTLSTFEPTTAIKTPRRFLSDSNNNKIPPVNKSKNLHVSAATGKSRFSWFFNIWSNNNHRRNGAKFQFRSFSALQGMGKLYCRGTRAMNDLLVAHLVEDINEDEFKLFLRLLFRSGLSAKADVVFVFPSPSSSSRFDGLIKEETDSFLKLVHYYKELNSTSRDSVSAPGLLRFDVTQFVKHGKKKEVGEPLWGKRIRFTNFNESEESGNELTRLSYGSVVGFDTSELDPENSLAGFLDHVPMSLKRWASYPMLLGRVRRNFKHIMLVDVKKLVLLSDPLGRVRNRSPESVYISMKQETSKHSKRNSDKTQSHTQVNPAILMGGARGIRRLSSAMLTEIARVAMQHKMKKNFVTESAILSQLVGNGHILKNIELITSIESIPEAIGGSNSNSSWLVNSKLIQRGNANHDVNLIIMKHICSCEVDSSVYKDC